VHFAHTAIKEENRNKLIGWLGFTVLLGILFLGLQVEEYVVAYRDMGLTLGSGIYGSTFFLLTGIPRIPRDYGHIHFACAAFPSA
jgi:cytochrome c oxidase subunit 3